MTRSRKIRNRKPAIDPVRTAILVTRVSSPNQAENDEGSLKNQLQRLRAYMDFRREAGEDWREAQIVELRVISGKVSVRAPEFQLVFELIQSGLVNTVLCTAIDRVCRSVIDFLNLFEFLDEHRVRFVSLREQLDTTTAQGRFVATILIALAEMERELTAQRTSEAMADRALRGLWNSGQLLGYDLDPAGPGTWFLTQPRSR